MCLAEASPAAPPIGLAVHRTGDGVRHGGQGRAFAVQAAGARRRGAARRGQAHALVRADHAIKRLRHDVGLPGQRQGRRRVAGGFATAGRVGGEQHARAAAQGAERIGAQFRPHAAHVAAIVAGLVDQVAQVQFAGGLRRLDLHAQLAVGVVEDDLVVTVAAEFLALEAT